MGLGHLKIGQARYRVEYKDLPTLYGQIRLGSNRIELADDLGNEEAVYGVLHETLHGIWYHRNVPPRPREERVVTVSVLSTLQWYERPCFPIQPRHPWRVVRRMRLTPVSSTTWKGCSPSPAEFNPADAKIG